MIDANKWFSPGERLVSIGFYINPYRKYSDAKFKHIFCFDSQTNFYVGQFSVYPKHIEEIFDVPNKLEYGFIYPDQDLVYFNYIESKDITIINKRLIIIAQRLYDYGMPTKTLIKSNLIDLGEPTIFNILKGKFLEKPRS